MENKCDSVDVDVLFPIPVYRANLYFNDDEWNLIQKTTKNFYYKKYDTIKIFDGEGTEDQKVLIHPEFSILREKINYHFDNYVFNILNIQNTKFSHSNSWINKHLHGDSSPSHFHANSTFSGVFYLNVPNGDSGNIKFYSEHNTISTKTFDFNIKEFNVFNSKTWEYTPENKLLLIFPSHLAHSVSENNTLEERYSLSFNYFIDGELGYNTQKLSLKVF